MHDDAFQEADKLAEAEDLWRMGHRRPWWQWNVITLFVVLFLLVWARELLRLSQTATWMICVLMLFAWLMAPVIALSRDNPDALAETSSTEPLHFKAGYLLAALVMTGAVVVFGGIVAGVFSVLAAIMYAAAVQKS